METSLLVGDEALRALADNAFRASYNRLYERCPWATAFQHLDFLDVWYAVYRQPYAPILALVHRHGELCGALALARSATGGLVAAGAHQAEYQGWLSEAATSDAVAEGIFMALRRAFPGRTLRLRYLPPGVPPLSDARHLSLTAHPRPFIDTARAVLRTKQRNKINNLNRLGTLHFEQLTALADYRRYQEAIELQYNLRQGCADLSRGFLADPHKRAFHERLFERGLLHVTLLRLDDELLAANLGLHGRDQVHLGVFSSHVYRRYSKRSPGIVHILLLAEHLRAQGIGQLDLTPGGEYKDEVANVHDIAHTLTVHPGRAAVWSAGLRGAVRRAGKSLLMHTGVAPADLCQRLALLSSPKTPKPVLLGVPAGAAWGDPLAARDPLPDILLYRPTSRGQPGRAVFLRQAVAHLEAGHRLFTQPHDGALRAWAFARLPGRGEADEAGRALPTGAALVQHLGFARGTPQAERALFVRAILAVLAQEPAVRSLWVEARGPAQRRLLTGLGLCTRGAAADLRAQPRPS